MDLKERLCTKLLENYNSEQNRKQNQVKTIFSCERPFYELGKLYATKPEIIEDIEAEIFGEYLRQIGIESVKKGVFLKMLSGDNGSLEDIATQFQYKLATKMQTDAIEFYVGFCESYRVSFSTSFHDLMNKNVELYNAFCGAWGFPFVIPTGNHYADRFLKKIDELDIPGVIELYKQYPKEISKKYRKAKQFVSYLKKHFKKK